MKPEFLKDNFFAYTGLIALVKGRLFNSKQATEASKQINLLNFSLSNMPFSWIGLICRLGIKNDLKIEFQRINKKDGDLPIALELDMNILKWADQHNLALLKDIFMIAALEALLQVCDKYKLSKEAIALERAKYGNIPNTIEECEQWEH